MKSRVVQSARISTITLAILLAQTPVYAEDVATPTTQQAASATTPWGIDAGDLTVDPTVKMGVLPNGMRYAIKHNETPKGNASVRLRFEFGSVAEDEDERGLAHFIEHMAFNGSTNVPEGEMTKILERLGLAFGADTNATTSLNFTIYKLDLPRTDDETVDTALFLMRETAGEVKFDPKAVDSERGIVLSEQQTRNSFGVRQIRHYFQFALPDTPLGFRLPTGDAEVLKTAPAERLRNLYERYYRPENATLVIVGDIDPAAIEQKIRAKFENWKGKGAAGKPINHGSVDAARPLAIGSFIDPAVPDNIEMTRLTPYRKLPNATSVERDRMLNQLASMIVSRRLDQMGRAPDARILGGSFTIAPVFLAGEQAGISVSAKEGQWRDALAIAEQESRRAAQHGFTAGELKEQLAIMENGYRTAAQVESSRTNAALAEQIAASVEDRSVVMAPSAGIAMFEALKPQLTLDAVNAAFRKAWDTGPNVVTISAKQEIADLDNIARATLDASSKVVVAAPADATDKAFAYDNFGKVGKVKTDKKIADLGIRTVTFDNGVRLNIKKTDFEAGKIYFGLRVGAGQLALPPGEPGLGLFMSSMFGTAGLEAHSFDELQRLLAGRNLTYGLNAEEDYFGRNGATTPQDLELQMKLLAAFVKAPGYRSEADAQWKNVVPVIAAQLSATPAAVAEVQVPRIVADGDIRFGIAEPAELAKRDMTELKAALSTQLANGPIEIGLVGDVDEAAAIAIVGKTFGALPKRAGKPVFPANALKVQFPADRTPVKLEHTGKADQGLVAVRWKAADDSDLKSYLTRELLADILRLELFEVVREKLGATYSPSTANYASSTHPGYGYLAANIVAEPGKMDAVMQAVRDIAKSLRDAPVSDDVLLRGRKPMLELFQKQMRENPQWVGMVSIAQSKPERLDRRRKRAAVLESITAADLQAAAKQYLSDEAMLEIRIVPQEGTVG